MEMLGGTTVPVRVDFQTDNPEDANAIKAEALVQGTWRIFGYVQKHKIPKLTVALRQGMNMHCKFSKKPQYRLNILNSGVSGLVCSITIASSTKWGPDDMSYRYNKDLTRL